MGKDAYTDYSQDNSGFNLAEQLTFQFSRCRVDWAIMNRMRSTLIIASSGTQQAAPLFFPLPLLFLKPRYSGPLLRRQR
ncbi:MAG TPA: hypothetical protein DCS89_16360 [Gammaproteobacteria bacterium]|nr:hypothetical protein [Gammaproteobacteria bacterium]